MQPQTAFIVPVRNDAARLAACLASIRRQADTAPTTVVDHGSSDGSSLTARQYGALVLVAPVARNAAALRNFGATRTTGAYLAFVDADHELDIGWLEAVEWATRAEVAAFGSPYRTTPTPTWVQAWYDALRHRPPAVEPIEWLGAGNLVIRRDAFEAVGGFDESLESCEDVDLCFRLARAGYTILNVPGMVSIHHGDPPTLGRLFRSELWRGRDNIRVSLRQRPLSLKNAASALMPMAQLVFAVLTLGGLAAARPALALLGLAGMGSLVAIRTAIVYRRARRSAPGGLPAALAFAATYEAARAAALVYRAGHHRAHQPLPQA